MKKFGLGFTVNHSFKLLTLFALAAVMILTAGCKAKTIRILTATGSDVYSRAVAEVYEKEKGTKVEIEHVPYHQLYEKIMISLTKGSGVYDLVDVPSEWIDGLASNFIPLNSYMKSPEKFIGEFYGIDYYSIGGNYLAIPWYGNANIGYYRTDLFEEAGLELPKTWDDYIDVAKKLTRDNIYGATVPGKRSRHLAMEFMSLVQDFGGEFLDKNNKPVFNSDAGVKALELLRSLIYEHKVTPPGALEMTYDESLTLFQQGRAAMTLNYPWAVGLLEDKSSSNVVGKWGMFARPGHSQLGMWGWAIPSDSKNKDQAWKFLEFLLTPEMQKKAAMEGLSVASRTVLADPEVLAKHPNLEAVKGGFENGFHPPRLAELEGILDVVAQHFSTALASRDSNPDLKKILDDAVNEVNSILEK